MYGTSVRLCRYGYCYAARSNSPPRRGRGGLNQLPSHNSCYKAADGINLYCHAQASASAAKAVATKLPKQV